MKAWSYLVRYNPVNLVSVALIRFYQIVLSPMNAGSCRFYPSCSQYALLCFQNFLFPKAMFLSGRRVLKCQPGFPGGFDYPPGLEETD